MIPTFDDKKFTRPQQTQDVCRGASRLLREHGLTSVTEVVLGNGRRADIAAITEAGELWIVEVKSCPADFLCDTKWQDYLDFCDRLFFAVAPDFPADLLPVATGLIVADRYGGEIVRPAPGQKLAPARRKTVTLAMLRTAAHRLQDISDPDGMAALRPADTGGPTILAKR
jgi:hypothetical protein